MTAFVQRSGTQLTLNGYPWVFTGFNSLNGYPWVFTGFNIPYAMWVPTTGRRGHNAG